MERLTAAIESYEKSGDVFELNLAHFHKGCCHYRLGDLGAALAESRLAFDSSVRFDDSRSMCSSVLWARASRGSLPFDQLKPCLPQRPDDIMSTVHAVLAEGYWHQYHRRSEEAIRTFEHAAGLVRKSLCINFHTITVLPALATALRLHADALQNEDYAQSKPHRRRALRLAKRAAWITLLIPPDRPLVLRELGLHYAAKGKTKKALKYFDKGCAVARKHKAKYEYARSAYERAKLAQQHGLADANEQLETAKIELAKFDEMIRTAAAATTLPQGETGSGGVADQEH